MVELTKAQRGTMLACQDWSSPFEVMWRRHEATGRLIDPHGVRNILSRLRNRGLVEYAMCNGTYRLTEAGRRALEGGNDG